MTALLTIITFLLACISIPLLIAAVICFFAWGGFGWVCGRIKHCFLWFFSNNYIFGDDKNERSGFDDYGNTCRGGFGQYDNKPRNHIHQWEFSRMVRHNWGVVGGKPTGSSRKIDAVIAVIQEKPGHTETALSEVTKWKADGAEEVYTSWNHWRCKIYGCNAQKTTEYYTAPCKCNGQPIIDLNACDVQHSKTFNNTTILPPIRREVAVEKMKRYS